MSTCVPVTVTDINHLRICGAAETLVVPLWISSHYWISLCEDRVRWNDVVHDWMMLRHISELSVTGKARNTIFGSESYCSFLLVSNKFKSCIYQSERR